MQRSLMYAICLGNGVHLSWVTAQWWQHVHLVVPVGWCFFSIYFLSINIGQGLSRSVSLFLGLALWLHIPSLSVTQGFGSGTLSSSFRLAFGGIPFSGVSGGLVFHFERLRAFPIVQYSCLVLVFCPSGGLSYDYLSCRFQPLEVVMAFLLSLLVVSACMMATL